MLSDRINRIRQSSITKYNDIVEQREKNGISFYKANIGQPNFASDDILFQSLKKYNKIINDYSAPKGTLELRRKYADYINKKTATDKYTSDNIIITQGASDALIKLLFIICDEKDEIIVLEPFFSDYKIYCDILGINITSVPYKEANFEKYITDKTKAILFSNPNNPDGSIINKKQISSLLKIAEQKNIYIISDEVYNEIIYSDKFITLLKYSSEKLIIIDSASKKLNACGSRIGFVISTNLEILSKMTILNDSKISISNIEQYVISSLLTKYKTISKSNIKSYTRRIKLINNILKDTSIKYSLPKGGITLLLELPIKDADHYARWLANEYSNDGYSILVTPANDFYISNEGRNKIRFSLVIDEDEIEKVIYLLLDSLKVYKEVFNND
ncbi:MAG: aminotransferase class I/II-fold pyridoxal phosphate-dependent enzyme [Bacilli bacterium]